MAGNKIFLLALVCGLQLSVVLACSDVMWTNRTMYDAVISARDYDFFAENVLTMQFSAMPARTQLTYTPTSGCKSPAGLSTTQARSKYGFIATTVGRPELIAGFWKGCGIRSFNSANFAGQLTEGFNTAGLSVGSLTEQSQPFPPNSTATPPPGARIQLYFNDVPTFLLANYKSVAEAKENFTPAKYSLVNNPAVYDALFSLTPIAATRIDHYPIHDVTGASAVIEYSLDAEGQFTFTVIDNPEGIVTNSPGLEVQRKYAEQFQQQQLAQFGNLNGLVMTPGFGGVGWDITTPENNNANSMSRFTILKMLKENVANTPFPDPEYLESPSSNPDPAHKAITMVLRMLDWVKIPGHWPKLTPVGPAPDGNQLVGAEEMTLVQFVKNHRRLIWYVKTAANEQWARFDLKQIFGVPSLETGKSYSDVEDKGGYHSYISPITKPVHKLVGVILPPTRQWATDKTAELLSR